MTNLKELLRDADPLRGEPTPSSEYRDVQRRAALQAVSTGEPRKVTSFRVRFAILAAVAIALLLLGERMWSPLVHDVHAAVRFEVRLAEGQPAPGLHKAKIAGTDQSIYLHDEIVLTNADIAAARLIQVGSDYSVGVEFNASGAEKIRTATRAHVGKPVAIILDGQVIMAPVLRTPIENSAQITGNFTKTQAERIVNGIIGK